MGGGEVRQTCEEQHVMYNVLGALLTVLVVIIILWFIFSVV